MSKTGTAPGRRERGGTRKAPLFNHLPVDRAQKLRGEWLEKQKIQNAYKKSLRKGQNAHGGDREESPSAPEIEISFENVPENAASLPAGSRAFSQLSHERRARPMSRGDRNTPQSHRPRSHAHSKDVKAEKLAKEAEETRIRDLKKDAYSVSSLHVPSDRRHTHRSTGSSDVQPKRRKVWDNTRGSQKPRGQPDMRKRMTALLAEIEYKHGNAT